SVVRSYSIPSPPRPSPFPYTTLFRSLDLHEWVAGAHGYVKTDALDHGDGVRLPGPADPAWDLAGAVVELGLDASAAAELAARHADAARESLRGAAGAPAAYLAPYAAWPLARGLLSLREAARD